MNIHSVHVVLLQVAGVQITNATDINDHGQIVGTLTDAQGNSHGYVYHDGCLCQVDFPDAVETSVLGINNLGQMVGYYTMPTGTSGFICDRGTFGTLEHPAAGNYTVAQAINDRGEIVGVYQDNASKPGSFLLKAGHFLPLLVPGTAETSVEDLNNNGQIIGNFSDPKGTHGFIYLENTGLFTLPVDVPPATVVALRAINNGGQIAGDYVDDRGNNRPFIAMAGALNQLLIPNAASVNINGINDHGQIVGIIRSAGKSHPFLGNIPAL